MENERIYAKIDRLRDSIENSDLTEIEKSNILRNIQELRGQKVNILITGATGCGKSSTINALFGKETAKVGITPDPETTSIERYDYDSGALMSGRIWPMSEQQKQKMYSVLYKCIDDWDCDDYSVDEFDSNRWQFKICTQRSCLKTVCGTSKPPHGAEIKKILSEVIGEDNCYFF